MPGGEPLQRVAWAAPPAGRTVCATCRTAQADAAGWGNLWQRAAARLRAQGGRWGWGGGALADGLTVVDPLPQLSWLLALGLEEGRRTGGSLGLHGPGTRLWVRRRARAGTLPKHSPCLKTPCSSGALVHFPPGIGFLFWAVSPPLHCADRRRSFWCRHTWAAHVGAARARAGLPGWIRRAILN